jgi:hypothetical protein
METLIAENKIDKAKDVIELAMTHMPVKQFEFYAFVEPFIDGYYKVGETARARALFNELKAIYQDHIDYYASIPLEEQYTQADQILSDLEAYKRLTDILIANDDRELAESETLIFNEQVDRIAFMNRGSLLEDLADPGVERQEDPDLGDSVQAFDSTVSDGMQLEGADSLPLPEEDR